MDKHQVSEILEDMLVATVGYQELIEDLTDDFELAVRAPARAERVLLARADRAERPDIFDELRAERGDGLRAERVRAERIRAERGDGLRAERIRTERGELDEDSLQLPRGGLRAERIREGLRAERARVEQVMGADRAERADIIDELRAEELRAERAMKADRSEGLRVNRSEGLRADRFDRADRNEVLRTDHIADRNEVLRAGRVDRSEGLRGERARTARAPRGEGLRALRAMLVRRNEE